MIEFTCPGCLSSHIANEAFVGLRARCVVCGAYIRIPATSGARAESVNGPPPGSTRRARARAGVAARSATASKPAKPRVSPAEVDSTLDLADINDTDEVPALDDSTPKPKSEPRVGAKSRVTNPTDPYNPEAESADDVDEIDEPDEPDEADEADPAKPRKRRPLKDTGEVMDPEARRKQIRQIGLLAGAIFGLGLVGYFVFAGEKKPDPKPPEQPAATPTPPPVEPPPPKKVEPPPPPATPDIAPPPRPAGAPVQFTTARFLAERTETPADFDSIYAGKMLILRGTLAHVQGAQLTLTENQDAEGGGFTCSLLKADSLGTSPPQPGQAVAVKGVYAGNLRLIQCEVVAVGCVGDEEYRDKQLELTGIIARVNPEGDDAERFPAIILESPTTDSPVSVRCLFRLTDKEQLAKLRRGQPVTVRGRCGGRSFRMVRFHDCSIVTPESAPLAATGSRVSLDRFFAAYESDLLAADRPDSAAGPIPVSAEQLAGSYGQNVALANAAYRNRTVQVTGRILTMQPGNHTVVLETGTNQRYQIVVAFTSTRYAALGDEAVLTVRGTCAGVRGAQVRIENAERTDTGTPETTVPRTTADFLPLQAGRELTYDLLEPAKAQNSPIRRVAIRTSAPDLVELVPLRSGTFPAPTLFGGDAALRPKWTKEPPKQKNAPQIMQHRVTNNVIELRDVPPAPAQPSQWWDPVLKLGLKSGEGWSSEAPDGRTISYSVVGFGKDAAGRDTLSIHRMAKNPKMPSPWEEWTITYVRGVGEVKRVVSWHASSGKGVTTLEKKLVEGEDEPKKPDPKKDGK